MGKVLGKDFNPTCRIRTDERKCTWVVDQAKIPTNFWVNFNMLFLPFFWPSRINSAHSGMV